MSFLRRLLSRPKEPSREFDDDWDMDEAWAHYPEAEAPPPSTHFESPSKYVETPEATSKRDLKPSQALRPSKQKQADNQTDAPIRLQRQALRPSNQKQGDDQTDEPISLQRLAHRITQLEARLDDLVDNSAHAPSHSDLLEVRIHSAKLAAELARTTVELRGEIGMATDEARRAAIRRSREDVEELVIDLREERQPPATNPPFEDQTSQDIGGEVSSARATPNSTSPITPFSPAPPRNPFADRTPPSTSEAKAQ